MVPDWKQPKYPLTDEWINKLGNIHANDLPIKTNKLLIYAKTLINL